jgi:hypothetical protein
LYFGEAGVWGMESGRFTVITPMRPPRRMPVALTWEPGRSVTLSTDKPIRSVPVFKYRIVLLREC